MFKLILATTLVALATATPRPRLDGRIVGGEDANIQEFPYQLSLQYYQSHICGASIVDKKWAITAAHCTYGSSASYLTLVAGISNLRDNGQRIKIKRIYQHPSFSMSTLDYDISVLELDGEINFDENRQPVGLPAANSDPREGTSVVVTGWGTLREGGSVSNTLQKVKVNIVGRSTCRDQYGGGNISDRMICAGVNGGGKDACQGDSGGPLVTDGQLVGVVSWGYGCARPNYAGIYTRVGALRNYVKDIIGF